jgi:hypothetical protein
MYHDFVQKSDSQRLKGNKRDEKAPIQKGNRRCGRGASKKTATTQRKGICGFDRVERGHKREKEKIVAPLEILSVT